MKSALRSAAALVACLSLGLGCVASMAAPRSVVKIGFLTTLSGPAADLGQSHKEGFELGLEMAGNRLGGLPVEVTYSDDKLNPENGVQEVRKLLDDKKVDFVTGVVFSNVLMAAYKPVVDSKTIFMSSFSGPSALSGASCNPYFFSSGVQNDTTYEAVGKYVSEQKNIKRVFILAPNYQGGRDAVAGFKRYFKGEVAGEIYTRLNQPDYSAELAQVRAAKPDAVYFFYPGTMGVTFVRQFSALKMNIPMYSGFSVEEMTIHGMGEAAVGAYSAALYNDDLKNAENQRFVEAYEKKYKRRPSIYAATGYDAVTILDYAVRSVKGDLDNKEGMREALRSAKFKLTRGDMSFNTNQFPIQNFYLVEAVDKPDLRMAYREVIFNAHKDAYSQQCKMK